MSTMRVLIPFALLCVAGFLSPLPLVGKELPPAKRHAIVIQFGDGELSFGREASIRITYQNHGGDPWVLRNPGESDEVFLFYRQAGTNGRPFGYSVPAPMPARAVPRPDGADVVVSRVGSRLDIPPGGTHVVHVPFERGWSGWLVPGIWDVWVHDTTERLESNHLQIPVRFTAGSIMVCLETVSAQGQRGLRQKSYATWLEKIMPGLSFVWWAPIATPKEREAAEAEISRRLDGFRTFLREPENAEAIRTAIARINQEAGLPPVADEKPVEAPAPEAGGKGGE